MVNHGSNNQDFQKKKKSVVIRYGKGFTLVELLVVIAIIGLLSSIVVVTLNSTRIKARTARRIEDLGQLQRALELYFDVNSSYPNSGGNWDGLYTCWGDSGPNWIAGLAPTFISTLPRDPRNHTNCDAQYIYNSNGADYKLISHNPEECTEVKAKYPNFIDPGRDCWAYGYWTPGARTW